MICSCSLSNNFVLIQSPEGGIVLLSERFLIGGFGKAESGVEEGTSSRVSGGRIENINILTL